jgi:hypothetical protein
MHSLYCVIPYYGRNVYKNTNYLDIKIGKKESKTPFKKWANITYKPGSHVLTEKKFPVSSGGLHGSLRGLEKRVIRTLLKKGYKKSENKSEHFVVPNTEYDIMMFTSIVDQEINKGL